MDSDSADASDRSYGYRGPSQLFLLRVWLDGSSENDWHGRVQHSVTGEAHYFQTCSELRRLIRDMMVPTKSDQLTDEA
jgi:hypothetical protein